jgi:hypothetical protein
VYGFLVKLVIEGFDELVMIEVKGEGLWKGLMYYPFVRYQTN